MVRHRLLVVSNGHGEDRIAAGLLRAAATALAAQEPAALPAGSAGRLAVEVLPIVGMGHAYEADGWQLLEPRREFPSGGLTMHHPRLLLADLRSGIVPFTMRQASVLRQLAPDAVLVVGDAYAQALAALVRAPRAVYQPLVSVHQSAGAPRLSLGRLFMDRIRAPELWLMRRAQLLFLRDEATAAHLRERGVPQARYLGNPMMDGLEPLTTEPGGDLPDGRAPRVALLPGTRGYRERSVRTMLAALTTWPGSEGPLLVEVAWSGGPLPAASPGWTLESPAVWRHREISVTWREGSFAEVLAAADAVIGTSGTANEQAAGLGLPVVAFPVPPDYGESFLGGQRRLLAGALEVVAADPAAIVAGLRRALYDRHRRQEAAVSGPLRMGQPGAGERIGAALAAWLSESKAKQAA